MICNYSAAVTLLLCIAIASTTNATCVDQVNPSTGVSSCPSQASLCTNPTYQSLMRQQCPKTCGYCPVATDPATAVGPCDANGIVGASPVGYTCGSGSSTGSTTTCADLVNPNTGVSTCASQASLCTNPIYQSLMQQQCPKTCGFCTASRASCPTGYTVLAGATPVSSICPKGATNYNNAGTCCVLPPATTDPATTATGPCDSNGIQGACSAGYACNLPNDPTNGKCFPVFDPNRSVSIGPAFNGQCPIGYVAMAVATANPPNQCFSLSNVPGLCAETARNGSCTNSGCQQGYYCNTYANACCKV